MFSINQLPFLSGENGSGKSTLLEALAVAHGFNPEGGTKNYVFSTHDTHSELCDAIRISKAIGRKSGVIFLGLKVFIMLQRRKKNMRISHILPLNIMKNHMERVFSHWHRIICVQMACIFLTNLKLHYPHRDSLHC